MFERKWKFLIVSIIVYQIVLTWCLFDLVDTAAYFSRLECGDWCRDHLYGFILTNQGAYETAWWLVAISVLLVLANAIVWVSAASRRRSRNKDVKTPD